MIFACVSGCQVLFPLHEGESDAAAQPDSIREYDAGESGAPCEPTEGYRAEVMKDEPALYLRLDEDGGLIAHDQTHTYDGTYAEGGVTYRVPGALRTDPDPAVRFDGNSSIRMPLGLDFSGTLPFTVELWVDTIPSHLAFALDHCDYLPARRGWDFVVGKAPTLERFVDGSTNGSVVSLGEGFDAGPGYHYFVATFDGTVLRLYVDGISQNSNGIAPRIASTLIPWTIANQNCTCSGNGYGGAMDEVAVYTKALSGCRISAHYRAAVGDD
jgi:hypothetical protein